MIDALSVVYLDLMAILVSAFDYSALAQDTSNLEAFKALRVLRALHGQWR